MLRHFPHGRTARTRIALVTALSASLIAVAFTVPGPSVASGDDQHTLTHRKTQLTQQIAGSSADLDEISRQLLAAQSRLDTAATQLSGAQGTLSGLRAEVRQAGVRDEQMQQALDTALQRLSNAKSDLTLGQRTVARQRSALAAYAISSSSTRISQLSTVSMVLNADSARAAISQVQGAGSALDKQLTDLQRLQANQVLLTYTEGRIQAATDQVAADRRAAAANLAAKQRLETAAAAATAVVTQQVATLQTRKDSLARAKTAELARIAAMKAEQVRVQARLARLARIAAARAAAAQRAADRRAASTSTSSSSASSSTVSSDGGFLSYPVENTYITSPYGMRLNPVIHVWELHDGTDFHAPCGTPVYAAASGRISSEYWNDAYGNRLFIDHGIVNGVSLSTSYNHLTSYVAHVGQTVRRGQLVAYSGTTGWSTACHLHFSVYVNGTTVNPVTWL